jgi:hypothetical protein
MKQDKLYRVKCGSIGKCDSNSCNSCHSCHGLKEADDLYVYYNGVGMGVKYEVPNPTSGCFGCASIMKRQLILVKDSSKEKARYLLSKL